MALARWQRRGLDVNVTGIGGQGHEGVGWYWPSDDVAVGRRAECRICSACPPCWVLSNIVRSWQRRKVCVLTYLAGLSHHLCCLLAPHLNLFNNWPTSLVGGERRHLRGTAGEPTCGQYPNHSSRLYLWEIHSSSRFGDSRVTEESPHRELVDSTRMYSLKVIKLKLVNLRLTSVA